jgi:hypothetical protein
MAWDVEFTEEFESWWNSLSEEEQGAVDAKVRLLSEFGPNLGRPNADSLAKMSKHPNLKELRVQYSGNPYRILFAFDPRRIAILLLGDRKPDQNWYTSAIAKADRLYDEHLDELGKEGVH